MIEELVPAIGSYNCLLICGINPIDINQVLISSTILY